MNTSSQIGLPDHLAAWVLLGVIAVVLLLGLVFAALVLHLARRRHEGAILLRRPAPGLGRMYFDPPRFHEPPARWLTVRSTSPEAVQRALRLGNPMPCPLADGLTSSDELGLFVSPPIRGWILVTGSQVPDPATDVDVCFVWLRELSLQLGEVQYFAAHRALGHHAWARLLRGEVFRAYAWAGQTLWNQGEQTRAELDLKLACPDYGDPADPAGHAREGAANVDKVSLLAARWSIDPASIDLERQWPRPGIAGQCSST